MKCIIQRVKEAKVQINGQTTAQIGQGLLLFVCAEPHDNEKTAEEVIDKTLKLRIFSDDDGKMNRSLQQVEGGLLIVSQFTLAADTQRGNRPSFTAAAPPAQGQALYDHLLGYARTQHPDVSSGEFGADMQIHLVNDGPVTIPLER